MTSTRTPTRRRPSLKGRLVRPSGLPVRRLATIRGRFRAAGSPAARPPYGRPASASGRRGVGLNIDFKRGDGGAGKTDPCISTAMAPCPTCAPAAAGRGRHRQRQLPANLQRPLDVVDRRRCNASSRVPGGNGGSLVQLTTSGGFESLAYQTGRDYVVEIVPRAGQKAVGARAVGAVPASAVAAAQKIATKPAATAADRSFSFQDVPVRTVLQLIAEESNLNIVASPTRCRTASLRLVNVPWDQALDIVLRAKGLTNGAMARVVCRASARTRQVRAGQ